MDGSEGDEGGVAGMVLRVSSVDINHLLTMPAANVDEWGITMSAHVTRPKLMPVSADPAFRSLNRLAVRAKAVLQTKTAVLRSKAMFGKDDLVDHLSRDLDRARGRRDALASEATTLTAQIAEIEARLSEEKFRRERDRVLGEIEAIKSRIRQAAGAFAPVVDGLSKAIESAAAVVPEARELNSFLVSVATEIDSVLDPLLRELDQRADAVRVGHVALDLPSSSNEAPIELPKDGNERLLRFPAWLSRDKETDKETAESPRSTAA
ncbi:hypothetical protein [Bradyrhizobium sp. CW9]|uniref:hypothetical protein n=1 Tax=Bradyrhizobium sp. CW9 TaxID=2782689 RepID=UPI001FFA6B89|nr:hypothetical protein [Bradyrhizobium sp. CW9]